MCMHSTAQKHVRSTRAEVPLRKSSCQAHGQALGWQQFQRACYQCNVYQQQGYASSILAVLPAQPQGHVTLKAML